MPIQHASPRQSHNISRVVSNFYGTEIEIWAGFEPVEITDSAMTHTKTDLKSSILIRDGI